MTPERWQKAREVFFRVRALAPSERVGLLDEACGDDHLLRAEVVSLLDHLDEAADFMEAPALAVVDDTLLSETPSQVAGRTIGSYTLMREIASGGMGIVYEARQDQPDRLVALKVMKAGIASRSALRRFQYESAILARLSHPAIAQVYEAGTHIEGGTHVPFFAMEFIPDAKTITAYAGARQLDLRQRLELFCQVCDGVHHGHQKGIIHRDLKPGNILVTACGQPKVIDFGVARVIDPDVTMAPTHTAADQLVGTLQYMSPEQLDGGSHELDIRSDVYALGIVLFELLCGQLPYDVTRSGIVEAARVIKEHAPPRPSTMRKSLQGDLDTIILKCLEKDRERRYQSATDLASDIQRYLRNEPIEARRDSSFYVLRKNLHRHRRAVIVAGLSIIGLIVFAVTTTVLWRQAEFERHKSDVRLGRMLTREGNPLLASKTLWGEFFKHDSKRTRFALWEFYQKYPCIYANDEFRGLTDVEYSPSGSWLVSIANEGELVCYEARTGADAHVLRLKDAKASRIKFSPTDPPLLYVGDTKGKIHVLEFDENRGSVIKEHRSPLTVWDGGPVTCLAVSASGSLFAGGASFEQRDESLARVRLWDGATCEIRCEWEEKQSVVTGLAFSHDGGKLAGTLNRVRKDASKTGRSFVLNVESEKLKYDPHPGGAVRRGALFSKNGFRLYSAEDGLRDWTLETSDEKVRADVRQWGVRALAAPESTVTRYVALGGGDGLIRFYDLQKDEFLPFQGYHEMNVGGDVDVTFSPDDRRVASAGPDGLKVWTFLPKRELVPDPNAPIDSTVKDIRIAGRATACLVVRRDAPSSGEHGESQPAGAEHRVVLLANTEHPSALVLEKTSTRCNAIALSDNGQRVAVFDDDNPPGCIRVFEASSPHSAAVTLSLDQDPVCVRWSIEHPNKPTVNCLHWLDKEGRVLLVGFSDGRVAAWRVDRAVPDGDSGLVMIHEFDSPCTDFCADDQGEWLAACSEGGYEKKGRVCLWRATGRSWAEGGFEDVYAKCEPELVAHEFVWRVALVSGADGRHVVATAGSPRKISLWDAETGELIEQMTGHRDVVRCCAALGRDLLVTASDDLTVRIWDVVEREELCILYRCETPTLVTAVRGSTIAVSNGTTMTLLDTADIQGAIAGNRDYEYRRLLQPREPGVSGD